MTLKRLVIYVLIVFVIPACIVTGIACLSGSYEAGDFSEYLRIYLQTIIYVGFAGYIVLSVIDGQDAIVIKIKVILFFLVIFTVNSILDWLF